jgi:hypothetical protein
MRRALLAAAIVLAAVSVAPTALARVEAPVGEGVQRFDQPSTKGFFRGRSVRYLDLGVIRLAPGNKVAPIWAFTNGTRAQHNVIDTVPGMRDYTPLWRVTMLTWRDGVRPRTLRSAAAVRAAIRAGELTARKTRTVVNCPVLGFGQSTTPGFAKGEAIVYLDLGPVKLRPGNKVARIWAFTNGADEQRNIVDTVPGDEDYTPLWRVTMVTWRDGVAPRTLRSAAEVQAAQAAGEVTLQETGTVVNCPIL